MTVGIPYHHDVITSAMMKSCKIIFNSQFI